MPTTTVYANRAAMTRSGSPNTSTSSGLTNTEIKYMGAGSGEITRPVYGFSVPKELYGKQVTSGYVTFVLEQLIASESDFLASALIRKNPEDLVISAVTYNNAWDGVALDEKLLNNVWRDQKQTHASSTVIAKALNGITIIPFYKYSNKNSGATVTTAPAITFTYSDTAIPNITQGKTPGYKNPNKEILLSCLLADDIVAEPNLTAAKLRWRIAGQSDYTEIPLGTPVPLAQEVDHAGFFLSYSLSVPAKTFPTKQQLEWQIQVELDGQWWSQNAAWEPLSTVDSISRAVPKAPVNALVDTESDNVFSWEHINATSSDPTGYDLQYSTNGETWQPLSAKQNSDACECTIARDTLLSGKSWWRVRTYNADQVAGEWSGIAAIVGYGAPPAPIIVGIENSARPLIVWQSAVQIAFELEILQQGSVVLHVDETAGTEKRYRVKQFLDDGTYTLKIRVKSSGLYWSAWAGANFLIKTVKPPVVSISGTKLKNGVLIETDPVEDMLYLLRDRVPIAKMPSGFAEDYCSVGVHRYMIRRVTPQNTFSDSAVIEVATNVEQAVIAPSGSPRQMIAPLLQIQANQYPSSLGIAAEMRYFAGRRYPVAAIDESVQREFTPAFASLSTEQVTALQLLTENGEPVIYRNVAGDCAHCIITAMTPIKAWNGFTTWEMTMRQVDFVECIEYSEVI